MRADSEISTVEELEGHRVSVGEEESGTKQNALQILAAYGLNEKLVEEVSLNYTEAAKELENGSIDAFLYGRSADGCNRESGAADRNPVPEC